MVSPQKKKEFADTVKEIVDEDTFKLLTNPSYFNEHLHWTKQRDLLLEIAGDVSDEEVINSNKDLSKLLDVLEGRSIEGHRKMIASKRKEINQELDRIPIRIDEIYRGMPDLNGINEADIKAQIDALNSQIEAKQQQINDIRSGSEVNNIRKQISDIELQLSNLRNEHAQQGQQQLYSLKARLQEEQSNVSILQSKIRNQEDRKQMNESNISGYKEQMQTLRDQWSEKNAQEFDHESNCSCPTCGQNLPEEQLEEVKANFNRNKAKLLETITDKGKSLGAKVEQLKNDNLAIDLEINKLSEQIDKKQTEIQKLQTQIQNAESTVQPIEENPSYKKLLAEKNAAEQQILNLQQSVNESVQVVQNEIASLKEHQNNLQLDLNKFAQTEASKKRIAELERDETRLADEYEELEKQLYMTEVFIRSKVNMLTEKINSKFKYARFNLFKTNINGGLEEKCETTYEGVPYGGGLNNAAKINVGLDIINTLSQHYGVRAPIFVDNAESVTKLIDIDAQMISLIVPPTFDSLPSETKQTLIKLHGSYAKAIEAWNDQNKQLRIENKAKDEVA
ncbi:hypothetical protein RWE15_14285 [Virgibacillus halophilus]|uniref:Exonuclease SbcC n=1 Tax=Tigheibacillus halophilus TaxID=361280 RepID=A0ABU5C848_9BACI|nr:hypothetical protein [Virgibacillus halophilus]